MVVLMAATAAPSPLPSPEVLDAYARIDPALPAKLADQFIAQGGHRMQLE
jgi:hypothetical protein